MKDIALVLVTVLGGLGVFLLGMKHLSEGLQAVVYTQLSDVEAELNGLLTWDRRELKVDPERMRALNEALKAPERNEE